MGTWKHCIQVYLQIHIDIHKNNFFSSFFNSLSWYCSKCFLLLPVLNIKVHSVRFIVSLSVFTAALTPYSDKKMLTRHKCYSLAVNCTVPRVCVCVHTDVYCTLRGHIPF